MSPRKPFVVVSAKLSHLRDTFDGLVLPYKTQKCQLDVKTLLTWTTTLPILVVDVFAQWFVAEA